MTNEEKAKEIAEKVIIGYGPDHYDTALEAALDMAKFKDEHLDEELNLITDWFNHIVQIADDKKTLNGVVMRDSDAFDEIKCLAKRCAEYVDKRLLNI